MPTQLSHSAFMSGVTNLSELGEVRALVHVSRPALGDDLVEVGVAVRGPLQAVPVPHATHHLAGTHPGVRRRTWKMLDDGCYWNRVKNGVY